ncbi:hypothetical protein ALC57_05258 [Trachymyrmex cornetzi]|uniref:Uncharacterized protein n=1 Tax=Trachymyrmex cornetzi TaxID=471704 RepID=A0A151JB60_9HYME|nr:hypothetical protein ALC57_05258 [Trachymyrmex cornetzi]
MVCEDSKNYIPHLFFDQLTNGDDVFDTLNFNSYDIIIMTTGPLARWSPHCWMPLSIVSYRDSCRSPSDICFQQSPANVAYLY